ncbi:MAG: hypothetical protein PHC60_03825 [Heliobacteriaceae bacterium]|nr:hypothetical protein [Heliobacteriaceae bacterium]
MGLRTELATKEKALQKLDEEYRRYRQALEAAFSLAEEMLQRVLVPVRDDLQSIREQLSTMQTGQWQQTVPDGEGKLPPGEKLIALPQDAAGLASQRGRGRSRKKEINPETGNPRRIRWGSTTEEIRRTVFNQLQLLEGRGKEITITTIKAEIPSMMRYVYGEKALFKGIGDLLTEYRQEHQIQESPVGMRVVELPARVDDHRLSLPIVEQEAAQFSSE